MGETHEREVLIKVSLQANQQRNSATEKALRQAVRGVQQEATQGVQNASRKSSEAIKATQRAIAEQSKATQRAVAEQQRAVAGLGERFSTVAESAMRFGRGLAMLGATGEESLDKMLRKLIKIQAVFDMTVGGFNMLQRGAGLWNQVGTATGMGRFMGRANTAQMGVIAAGGASLAAVAPSLFELGRHGEFRPGGSGESYLKGYAGAANRIGMAEYLPWEHMRQLAASEQTVGRAEKSRTEHQERLGALGGAMGGYYAAQIQRLATQQRYGGGDVGSARDQLGAAQRQVVGLQQARHEGTAIVTDQQLTGATALYEAQLERFVSLREQERSVVMETARAEIDAANEKLSALQAGLSAQQRFGALGVAEQTRIATAAQRPIESVQQASDVLRFAAEGSKLQQRAQQFLEQRGAARFQPFATGYGGGGGGSLRDQAEAIRANIKETTRHAEDSGKRIADEINKQMELALKTLGDRSVAVIEQEQNRVERVLTQRFDGLRDRIIHRQYSEDSAG